MKPTKHIRELRALAARCGVYRPEIVSGGRHPKLIGQLRGRTICVPVAGTLSDNARGFRNIEAQLRRMAREVDYG